MRRSAIILLGTVLAIVALAMACGGDDKKESTPSPAAEASPTEAAEVTPT
jgi:hypothetical protein